MGFLTEWKHKKWHMQATKFTFWNPPAVWLYICLHSGAKKFKKKCSKMCFLSIVRVLPVGSIMSGKYVEHYQNSTMCAWNRISRGHPRVKVKFCRFSSSQSHCVRTERMEVTASFTMRIMRMIHLSVNPNMLFTDFTNKRRALRFQPIVRLFSLLWCVKVEKCAQLCKQRHALI